MADRRTVPDLVLFGPRGPAGLDVDLATVAHVGVAERLSVVLQLHDPVPPGLAPVQPELVHRDIHQLHHGIRCTHIQAIG